MLMANKMSSLSFVFKVAGGGGEKRKLGAIY